MPVNVSPITIISTKIYSSPISVHHINTITSTHFVSIPTNKVDYTPGNSGEKWSAEKKKFNGKLVRKPHWVCLAHSKYQYWRRLWLVQTSTITWEATELHREKVANVVHDVVLSGSVMLFAVLTSSFTGTCLEGVITNQDFPVHFEAVFFFFSFFFYFYF